MIPVHFNDIFQNNRPVVSREILNSLHYPLTDCEFHFTSSPEEIAARQQIFRDFLSDDTFYRSFTEACAHMDDLAELLRSLGQNETDSAENLLYALVELLAFTDTVDAMDAAYSTAGKLSSERLLDFFGSIRKLKESDDYRDLCSWLHDLDNNLRSIRSLTLGVNLDAQLNITEVGIVSINNHPYVCGTRLDKVMREEQPGENFECLTVVGIREVKSMLQSSRLVLNTEFYNAMNVLYRSALKTLRRQIFQSAQSTMRALAAVREDFRFLIDAVTMIRKQKEQGFRPVFPEIAPETAVDNLYNPLLADKCRIQNIVPSALNFTENEKIYILTGPNSGGKSVYITAIGTAQLTFQLGLPVCAAGTVRMKPYEKIVTHFIETTKGSTESRLANESQRLQKSLAEVGRDTLLLLDETFSSTSAYDALFLSETLMRHLAKIGCDAVYVTHLHELPSRLIELPVLHHITPEVRAGQRTYRIVPYLESEETASLAKDIVIENGLGFLFDD